MDEPQLPLTCYKCEQPIRRRQWVCWNCRAILFADHTGVVGTVFSLLFLGLTIPLYLSIDSGTRRYLFAAIVCAGLMVMWIGLFRHSRAIREIDRDYVDLVRESERRRKEDV